MYFPLRISSDVTTGKSLKFTNNFKIICYNIGGYNVNIIRMLCVLDTKTDLQSASSDTNQSVP